MEWEKILSTKRMRQSTRPSERDNRNEFESDYGRVVFSPALRRMHDKTQVFPLLTDDNIHTRLTHSLEVQAVCSSIGMNLCLEDKFSSKFESSREDLIRTVPVILSSISLCHDIGNPPFGHFGEKAICAFFTDYFKNKRLNLNKAQKSDFLEFDGNAQGFRVLTRLQPLQDKYGLNLTFGTLSAFLKYPNLSNEIDPNQSNYKNRIGIFQSEKDVIDKIRKETKLNRIRNPLSFIMEAADSICYLVMDIEDGFNKGYFHFQEITDYLESNGNRSVKESLRKFESFLKKRINSKKRNVKRTEIVNFRIFYIQELVNEAILVFLKNIEKISNGSFIDELIFTDKNGVGKTLKKFNYNFIFSQREIQTLELTGEKVLKGLLTHFVNDFIDYSESDSECAKRAQKLYSVISNSIKSAVHFETRKSDFYEIPDYYKLRTIVDYISGMTDQFALKTFQQLQGIRII